LKRMRKDRPSPSPLAGEGGASPRRVRGVKSDHSTITGCCWNYCIPLTLAFAIACPELVEGLMAFPLPQGARAKRGTLASPSFSPPARGGVALWRRGGGS
jgi:hypothetical protein